MEEYNSEGLEIVLQRVDLSKKLKTSGSSSSKRPSKRPVKRYFRQLKERSAAYKEGSGFAACRADQAPVVKSFPRKEFINPERRQKRNVLSELAKRAAPEEKEGIIGSIRGMDSGQRHQGELSAGRTFSDLVGTPVVRVLRVPYGMAGGAAVLGSGKFVRDFMLYFKRNDSSSFALQATVYLAQEGFFRARRLAVGKNKRSNPKIRHRKFFERFVNGYALHINLAARKISAFLPLSGLEAEIVSRDTCPMSCLPEKARPVALKRLSQAHDAAIYSTSQAANDRVYNMLADYFSVLKEKLFYE